MCAAMRILETELGYHFYMLVLPSRDGRRLGSMVVELTGAPDALVRARRNRTLIWHDLLAGRAILRFPASVSGVVDCD